ncbi:MAG: hypothetical protein AAGJ82_01450 [Bacteroidota bacterium]
MSKLKGFLFPNPKLSHSYPYEKIFDLIKREGISSDKINFQQLLTQPLPVEAIAIYTSPELTLGIGPACDLTFLYPLRKGNNLFVFDIDTEKMELSWQFCFSKLLLPKESLEIIQEKSLLALLGLPKYRYNGLIQGIEKALHKMLTKHQQSNQLQASWLLSASFQQYTIARLQGKYTGKDSYSTTATPFNVDRERIRLLMPSMNRHPVVTFIKHSNGRTVTEEEFIEVVEEAARMGDVNPAFIYQKNPLGVCVYSSDLDAVMLLDFVGCKWLDAEWKDALLFTKLISVNTYAQKASSGHTTGVEVDLIEGPNASKVWKCFTPHIMDFITTPDDKLLLAAWRERISPEKWARLEELFHDYQKRYPNYSRYGYFMMNYFPTTDFFQKFRPDLLKK